MTSSGSEATMTTNNNPTITGGNTLSGVGSFDSLVQNALAVGVPPQQVLQFLQNNLQVRKISLKIIFTIN